MLQVVKNTILLQAILWVVFGLVASTEVAMGQESKKQQRVSVPLFRHIDSSKKEPDYKAYPVIRFAVSDEFPPFSYRTRNGALTGFNIAIANSVCRVLRVECLFMVKQFDEANNAIEKKEADAIITGLRENDRTARRFSFTRPYFRFSARFAVRQSTPVKSNDVRSMAGKRLGVVTRTQHARFLKEHFKRSKIREFDTEANAREGLRTGAIDALFGDSLKLMFWITGKKSKNCCQFVGDAYLEPQTFSQPMSIAVERNNRKLRNLLDHALDRLQSSGRYSKIFRQYFPLSPWTGDANGNGSARGSS